MPCSAGASAVCWSDVFGAAGERNRLESDNAIFFGVLHRKLHYGADLVRCSVYDGHHHHDLTARLVHVLEWRAASHRTGCRSAVAVRRCPMAVKLQVGIPIPLERLRAEPLLLATRSRLVAASAVVANLARIRDCIKEYGLMVARPPLKLPGQSSGAA